MQIDRKSKIKVKQLVPYIATGMFDINKSFVPDYNVKISGRNIPDFNEITFGTFVKLSELNETNILFLPAKLLLGMTEKEILKCRAYEILSLTLITVKELARITNLFASIKNTYTPEEIKAGIKKMNNGYFGMADWYAKRMGIIDHDYVFDCVPWIRIYKCMEMDSQINEYKKRLKEILKNKR